MNYPEELREKYNEVMYDERDIIEKFLKDQYDLRYGHQRDTWHFEPAVSLLGRYGLCLNVTDIKLDSNKFVTFTANDPIDGHVNMECFDFAYGELSKIIEALPDVNNIMIDNAKSDIARMCNGDIIYLKVPFNTFIKGLGILIWSVDYEDGHIKAYTCTGKNIMDETNTGLVLGLRNHISIDILHRSDEYKRLREILSCEANYYSPEKYGDVFFTIDNTDMEVNLTSATLDENGKMTLCVQADNDEEIHIEEKDIKKEYLEAILSHIESTCDIIDTCNGHDPELVRKINDAWHHKKHYDFEEILLALLYRDHMEYESKFGEILDYSEEYAMEHAREIMEGVCDDQDLQTILSFIRYKF